MSVKCPRCQVENRDQAKRCMACNTDLSLVRPSTGGASQPTRLCPDGRHPMDPSWDVCPYCKAAQDAKRGAASPPTVAASPPPPSSPPPPAPPPRRKTAFAAASPAAAPPAVAAAPAPAPPSGERQARRRTEFAPAPAAAPVPPAPSTPVPPVPSAPAVPSPAAAPAVVAPPGGGRRIVGLLITYTWQSDGQVFPVREGRNYLGSDPDSDVALDGDPQLSGRHATILFRGQGFWIDDEKSMNGTFVDGECVEEKQPLANYAEIRTGSTVWRFVMVDRPPGA